MLANSLIAYRLQNSLGRANKSIPALTVLRHTLSQPALRAGVRAGHAGVGGVWLVRAVPISWNDSPAARPFHLLGEMAGDAIRIVASCGGHTGRRTGTAEAAVSPEANVVAADVVPALSGRR